MDRCARIRKYPNHAKLSILYTELILASEVKKIPPDQNFSQQIHSQIRRQIKGCFIDQILQYFDL